MCFMRFICFFILFFQVLESRMIRIAGDSHANMSFKSFELDEKSYKKNWIIEDRGEKLLVPFKIAYLGPITMHRIGRDGLLFFNEKRRRKIGACEGDVVVFSFGEIDVKRSSNGSVANIKLVKSKSKGIDFMGGAPLILEKNIKVVI